MHRTALVRLVCSRVAVLVNVVGGPQHLFRVVTALVAACFKDVILQCWENSFNLFWE